MKSVVRSSRLLVAACVIALALGCAGLVLPAYADEQGQASSSSAQSSSSSAAVQDADAADEPSSQKQDAEEPSSAKAPDAGQIAPAAEQLEAAPSEPAADEAAEPTPEPADETLEAELLEAQQADAAATMGVPVHVRNEQTMARQVYDLINKLRSSKGLPKLGWNASLEQTATTRAAEITLLYDYERPSGQKNLTAFPAKAKTPVGESIEKTYESYSPAAQLFNNLENNPGHHSYLTSKDFKSVGIAVMSTRDNGQLEYYISVCYSADASSASPGAAKDASSTMYVDVPASLATGVVVTPAMVSTNVGSTVQLPTASVSFSGGSFSRTLGNVPYDASKFTWAVGDSSIAGVNTAGVKGNARGTTSCTVTLKGTNLSGTFSVNVGTWVRLWGDDALQTMKQITCNGFGDGSCKTVVLATMSGYWDALSASGLAGMNRCPVLLTDPSRLSSQAASEIKRLGASRVVIAGGPAAVSENVKQEVSKLAGVTQVQRVYGNTAVGTALAIYEQGKREGTWGTTAIIATVNGYWDALSASPYSYAQKMPIFLAGEAAGSGAVKLDAKTLSTLKAAIQSGKVKRVLICGGTAAISPAVQNSQLAGLGVQIIRKAGATADLTSSQIASWCVSQGMADSVVGVATIDGYWDALTGAALCGMRNGPIVLAGPQYQGAINGYVAEHAKAIQYGFVFGGTAAVPASIYDKLVSVTG